MAATARPTREQMEAYVTEYVTGEIAELKAHLMGQIEESETRDNDKMDEKLLACEGRMDVKIASQVPAAVPTPPGIGGQEIVDAKIVELEKKINDELQRYAGTDYVEKRIEELRKKMEDVDYEADLKKLEETVVSIQQTMAVIVSKQGVPSSSGAAAAPVSIATPGSSPVKATAAGEDETKVGDEDEEDEEENPRYTKEDLEPFTVEILKQMCRDRGLADVGKREQLIEYLTQEDPKSVVYSSDVLMKLKKPDLQRMCAEYGTPSDGKKSELVSRLVVAQSWKTMKEKDEWKEDDDRDDWEDHSVKGSGKGHDMWHKDAWKGATKGKGKGARRP